MAVVAVLVACGVSAAGFVASPSVGGKTPASGKPLSSSPARSTTTLVPAPRKIVLSPTGLTELPPAMLLPRSIFTSSVQAWNTVQGSSQYAAAIVYDYKTWYGAVGVNTSFSTYQVPAKQPRVHLFVSHGCNNFLPGTGTSAPIPPYAEPGSGSDAPLIVYQPSTGYEWEFWQVSKVASGWAACWGGRLKLTSSQGVFPFPYGLSASGISYLATEITEADVASGAIRHAIAMGLPNCNWPDYPKYVFPADRTDCGNHPGNPAEGQWFRFASSVNCSNYDSTRFEEMVCKAIQVYGAVVLDQNGAVQLVAEDPADWAAQGHKGLDPMTASWGGQQEYAVVANLPWDQLQTVAPPGS
ncbi:MAG TPA: hypothetical protein VME46_02540 [Acidimicrobiales bacterium]|nr:hypothetical protein [Acidimicrobiales bacterium]